MSALVVTAIGACGGGGGDPGRGVAPPPPRTTLASVDVSPASAEVALDSALGVTATAFAAANTSLPTAVTYAWSRRGTAGGTITSDGGTGGATYRAGGPGVDTLTVAASAPGVSAPATATAVVTVRGPRVARVAYPAQRAYVGVGGSLALPAVGRDASGAAVAGAAITYRVEGSGVAVAADGTLTGTAAGTARVVATANTVATGGPAPADTLDVVIAGGADALGLALVDTVAQPGRAVTLLGADLAGGAAVTLDGTALPVTGGGAGGVVAAVPGPLYPTCRLLGATAPFAVTAGGRSRTLALAVYAPLVVALAPGQHRRLTEAAAGGCPVAVDQAGTYVAMPFAWDRQVPGGGTAGGPTQATTTALRVSTGADLSASTAAASAAVGLESPARFSAARLAAPAAPVAAPDNDVIRLAVAAPSGARRASFPASWTSGACPIPTVVGDAMPVGTLRDAQGRFVQTGATAAYGGRGVEEPWTLAAVAPSVAVFFDSALVRANVAGATGRAQAFAAAYDSTVAPLLAGVTEGVPDADGTGRVVVLVALRAGGALAYPRGYGRMDCTANNVTVGEAISLGGDAFVAADAQVAPAVSVAAHEAAHVVDTGDRYMTPAIRQDTWWSREGYAVLMQHLWSLGPTLPADVFTANRSTAATRTILGTAQGSFCERPERAVLGAWYGLNGEGYPLACQAVRYALGQLARQQAGLSPKALLTRWSELRDRRRFTDAVNGLLGQTRAAQDVAGEWYLSWVADGVAGTAATLQDPAADLRALYRVWFPTPGGTYPVPAATLAAGQTMTATLGEPDAVHVQVALPAGGWVAVTDPAGPAGLPTSRTDLMLFRVK